MFVTLFIRYDFPYTGMFRYLGPKVYLFGKTQLNILPEMLLNYISDTHFDTGLSLIIRGRKKKHNSIRV